MAGTLLKGIMKKNCGILSLTMLLNIGGMAGELLSPLFIGWVIQAIIAEDYERVNRTIIYWVIISSCGSLASFISSYGYTMIANYTGQQLRQELFEVILQKDVEFFDSRKTGDLISRLVSDTTKVENAVSSQLGQLVKASLFNIGVVFFFFYISWKLCLFILAMMVPIMIFTPVYGRFMRKV